MELGIIFSQSSGPSLILSIVPSTCEEMVSLLSLPQPHISSFSPLPCYPGTQSCGRLADPTGEHPRTFTRRGFTGCMGCHLLRGTQDTLAFLLPFYSFNEYVLNAFFNPSTVSVAEIKQTQIPFFMEFTFSLGVILIYTVNNENTENLR